jgi:hypothetical protein
MSQKVNMGVSQAEIDTAVRVLGILGDLFPFNGTRKEADDYVAYFNDWESRDKEARARGTYDQGRFSFAGKTNGKWFACRKG